jgi:alpha-D-ribose 1-methylphosphonate 5-triphosphate diphosphatase
MNLTVYKNARLVLPNEVVLGSLSVSEGKISTVDQGLANNLGGWDVEGDYLMPGFFEMHTDNFERHLMPRPKVQWAEMPALIAHDAEVAAAGITTVFDALGVGDADPDSLRGSTWQPVIETIDTCAREGLSLIHI